MTIRSGSRYANGFSRTVLTTEKIAVFVAMPSARAATAVIAKPGDWMNIRVECCRSFRRVSITQLDVKVSHAAAEATSWVQLTVLHKGIHADQTHVPTYDSSSLCGRQQSPAGISRCGRPGVGDLLAACSHVSTGMRDLGKPRVGVLPGG
jgi:hypothetical protein